MNFIRLFCVYVQRLQGKVLKLVDISYGGEQGFSQAIELAAEVLSNVKFVQEKKLIGKQLCFVSWCSKVYEDVTLFYNPRLSPIELILI